MTSREIVDRFTPHWPRLHTPPLSALSPVTPLSQIKSKVTGLPLPYVLSSAYQPDTPADIEWSEYNHNWAGLCVLTMGILAVLAQTGHAQWARHWPLGFLGLALFLLVRSDPKTGRSDRGDLRKLPDGGGRATPAFRASDRVSSESQVVTRRPARIWPALALQAICWAVASPAAHPHSFAGQCEAGAPRRIKPYLDRAPGCGGRGCPGGLSCAFRNVLPRSDSCGQCASWQSGRSLTFYRES